MTSPKIKVIFPTEKDAWHGMTAETMWVEMQSDTVGTLRNNPLYAYGVSWGDVVRIRTDEISGTPQFDQVVTQLGHSTYRVLLNPGQPSSRFYNMWPQLESIGCSFESSADPEDIYAIDIPPSSDVNEVYWLLMSGEREGHWHLDEGNFEHVGQTH